MSFRYAKTICLSSIAFNGSKWFSNPNSRSASARLSGDIITADNGAKQVCCACCKPRTPSSHEATARVTGVTPPLEINGDPPQLYVPLRKGTCDSKKLAHSRINTGLSRGPCPRWWSRPASSCIREPRPESCRPRPSRRSATRRGRSSQSPRGWRPARGTRAAGQGKREHTAKCIERVRGLGVSKAANSEKKRREKETRARAAEGKS